MKAIRDFNEIKKDLIETENMSCKPNFARPKNGQIIDEEKSVRWNREEVERLQKEYDTEVAKLNTIKNKSRDVLYTDLYRAIQHEIGDKKITIDGAKKIFNYAYEEGHAYGIGEVFSHLYEVMDLFEDVFAANEKAANTMRR